MLLKLSEAAYLLGYTPRHLRRLCAQGRGPASHRLANGAFRLRPVDIAAFVRQRVEPSQAPAAGGSGPAAIATAHVEQKAAQ